MRAARPAAAATLPSLASPQHPYVSPAVPPPAYAPPPATATATATATAPAPGAAPVSTVGPALAYRTIAPRPGADDSQPILPPRPTNRMASAAPRASWKSWPVIVIALAVVAIIAAVVLMVWPADAPSKARAGTLAPPPAPERMDTNPVPSPGGPQGGAPQGGVDPWSDRHGAAPDPAPSRPTPPSPAPDIDDIQPPTPNDPNDPLAGIGRSPMDLVGAIFDRACTRLASCPSYSATMRATCEVMQRVYPARPPTCAAAQRCLARFDSLLTCDGDLDPAAVFGMLNGMDDCAEALRC